MSKIEQLYFNAEENGNTASELLMKRSGELLIAVGKQLIGMADEAKLREALSWNGFAEMAENMMKDFIENGDD